MPLGVVLDQADWNVGKTSFSSSKERTRLTTYRKWSGSSLRKGRGIPGQEHLYVVHGSPGLPRQWQWLQMRLHCLHSSGAPAEECHQQQTAAGSGGLVEWPHNEWHDLGHALLTSAIATLTRTAQNEAQLLLCRASLKNSCIFLGSKPQSLGDSRLFERRIFSLGLPLSWETMAFSEVFLVLVVQRPYALFMLL